MYSYDHRQAAEKTWYDIFADAQKDFMTKVVKDLAKRLKGKAEIGAFASGTVTYSGVTLQLGFTGGSIGTIYLVNSKNKRTEYSVVSHTPQTFAQFLVNTAVF